MIKQFKNWSISQALEHSNRTIIIALLLTIIIGSGIRFIVLDDNVMNMLPEEIDSRRVWDEIVDEFKYSDFLFVAFGKEGQDVLTIENLSLVWDFSKAFEMIPQVEEVISLSTINRMDIDDGFLEVNDLVSNRILNSVDLETISIYLQQIIYLMLGPPLN